MTLIAFDVDFVSASGCPYLGVPGCGHAHLLIKFKDDLKNPITINLYPTIPENGNS